jgi:putative ABC transport system permease protein
MKLAWANITHDRTRFVVTLAGIAFATFLMLFQSSLLAGFQRAASRLVDSTESDLWISGRGVACFEFSAPVPRRYAEVAQWIPGTLNATRVAVGFAQYRKPDGSHQVITLIGADPAAGSGFPVPSVARFAAAIRPESLLIDRNNAEVLSAVRVPLDVEVNRHRARIAAQVSGFSSFFGSPYVFTSYRDATHYLAMGPEQTSYILVALEPGVSRVETQHLIQARLPDIKVWRRSASSANANRLRWCFTQKVALMNRQCIPLAPHARRISTAAVRLG